MQLIPGGSRERIRIGGAKPALQGLGPIQFPSGDGCLGPADAPPVLSQASLEDRA